jgi:beta-galactosidase
MECTGGARIRRSKPMSTNDIPAKTEAPGQSAIPDPGRRRVLAGLAGFTIATLSAEAGQKSNRAPAKRSNAGEPNNPSASPVALSPREQSFDSSWLFYRGDAPGAEKPDFGDVSWRTLDLPHDWSIEDLPTRPGTAGKNAPGTTSPIQTGPFDAELSPGKESTGWVVGGTGWYRKHFSVAKLPASTHVEIVFDGVYMNAEVWLNGERLGNHPYGYIGFAFDLTPHLKHDGDNVIAVRVRNEGKNSRWYSGSGIYRHVHLTLTHRVRIPMWGIQVTTPDVSKESAMVKVVTKVENLGQSVEDVMVRLRVFDPEGIELGVREGVESVEKQDQAEVVLALAVLEPLRWSPRSPRLYRAEIEVASGDIVLDSMSVPFGIRSIEVDAARGLRINGETLKLKGGCLHHDNGVLGAAAIDRAEERRVELMKRNGFNAIRTSHNPPSPAFLNACDRLGMVVIDEAFDIWKVAKNPDDYHLYFDEWADRDFESMVLRDRNHPSVVFWSIGNEIPERADPAGVAIAERLADAAKRLDPSRPVTAAICGFWEKPGRGWAESAPAFEHLDVGGYNYEWKQYEPDHELFPQRVMMGTESFTVEAFENWQMV